MHYLMPNENEWIIIFSYINASSKSIPSFHIFKGKKVMMNFIQHCENGATMAMQPEGWMTATLFSHWISYFIQSLQ